MKEIKVIYSNGNDITWDIWDYTIEDRKLIYSAARDNSINIIKLDNIRSIEVDGEIVFDEFSEFRKEVINHLSRITDNRIVDIDLWKDKYFYYAIIIVISENHVVYRYYFTSHINEIKSKYESVEVF